MQKLFERISFSLKKVLNLREKLPYFNKVLIEKLPKTEVCHNFVKVANMTKLWKHLFILKRVRTLSLQ